MIIHPYKIDYNKWILKNDDMLRYIFMNLIKWIDANKDLDRFLEAKQSYETFCKFIYAKYIQPIDKYNYNFIKDDDYSHYEVKYGNDIMELFLNYKEITRSYNSRLFHQRRDFHIDLVDFVYSICDYVDPYTDDIVKEDDIHYYEYVEDEIMEY
jgi:hypothetical protein